MSELRKHGITLLEQNGTCTTNLLGLPWSRRLFGAGPGRALPPLVVSGGGLLLRPVGPFQHGPRGEAAWGGGVEQLASIALGGE